MFFGVSIRGRNANSYDQRVCTSLPPEMYIFRSIVKLRRSLDDRNGTEKQDATYTGAKGDRYRVDS